MKIVSSTSFSRFYVPRFVAVHRLASVPFKIVERDWMLTSNKVDRSCIGLPVPDKTNDYKRMKQNNDGQVGLFLITQWKTGNVKINDNIFSHRWDYSPLNYRRTRSALRAPLVITYKKYVKTGVLHLTDLKVLQRAAHVIVCVFERRLRFLLGEAGAHQRLKVTVRHLPG